MTDTIGTHFRARAETFSCHAFLSVPADQDRHYYPDGYDITYGEAAVLVSRWAKQLQKAGYGHGHRIAVLLANRPEMLLLKLALNSIGVSWVPVNPDYRPAEVAYLLQDSGATLALTAPDLRDLLVQGVRESGLDIPVVDMDADLPAVPPAQQSAPLTRRIDADSEASLIYTSGTTGRPKGCILSHDYELMMGQWYATRGGLIDFQTGQDRLYCPLPLFHVNAAILVLFCMIETGNCQIIPERFRASAWWRELSETKATVAHYLGIVIPALMNRAPEDWDTRHTLRFAVGAGVEPTLHRPFEERFGVPLIEVWGMSEMCRILGDYAEPRQIDTRAMGRPSVGLEAKVVDDTDKEVPRGTPGELVIRHSAETPRKGAFSGYLNLPEVTEESWKGGWFHTGDTVTMDDTGMIFFVDRKKNIIRRSGENIAAAEIEACLQDHDLVTRVAVVAVPDEMRDEEVMACVMVTQSPDAAMAQTLFDYSFERLAYYKAPGWIQFVTDIPVTGTQKIQKHSLFDADEDPTQRPDTYDMRKLKKRG
ncbi:ATP-dependent acyl-CoA ligase [Shimia litoralis]|uniref:ATP-dependent acyl-CoA ligase n=1 Tax=Shimia litoralis TaxID=420403 RepID=A0A4U7MWH1_9RHOB|nr:AMP-binding protein [Shimia litoralis]TKZ17146.1 ATP-dependent acyl-CoA ligase [Shimia litoralis]